MRYAVCAAAKVQNFSSRATVATNPLVRLKSAARSRPDSMVIRCAAGRRSRVMASSCAKSRRSNGSISSSKDNFETISNERRARKASPARIFCSCWSDDWIMLSIAPAFRLRGARRVGAAHPCMAVLRITRGLCHARLGCAPDACRTEWR